MSDYLPFEMQVEIIKKLPIKSVIQFRSVSKQWKSLIDSSKFITDYTFRHRHTQQREHLLVSFTDLIKYEQYIVSIVDSDSDNDNDDIFPQINFAQTVSQSVNVTLQFTAVIGSSHGLFCLIDFHRNPDNHHEAVIWNPLIKKSVVIVIPDGVKVGGETKSVIGFGVCPNTLDPKIVKMNDSSNPGEVEVFTLSSGVWRSIFCNLRSFSVFHNDPVVVGRFIYWLAEFTDGFQPFHMIISFDLSSEEFGEISLPDKLARHFYEDHYPLHKLRESLVILTCKSKDEELVFKVWMMIENRGLTSFTKLFNVRVPSGVAYDVLGFRKNDQVIMESYEDVHELLDVRVVEVYDPCSEEIKDLGIYGRSFSLFNSYTESLLLLDR